jgi:hypothetical protein
VARAFQIAIIVLAAAAAVAPISSDRVERGFSTTVYPVLQRAITPLSNAVPFALWDVLTVAAIVAGITAIVRGTLRARRERRLQPIADTVGRLAAAAAVVYLVFLGVWGFNYRRIPMAARLLMDRPAPSPDVVMALGVDAVRHMNELHGEAHRIGWHRDPRDSMALLQAYDFVQRRLSDATPSVAGRLKRTLYGPYFRWTTVDGMVNPLALEVLANPDLLPYERTFVAAHEWAHLAGYADESEANFVGWLTCVRADVPSQYSAWLFLYWQIGGEMRPPERQKLWDAVAPGPRADILAINDRLRRGQLPLLRNASWRVYDQYLRANRVEEGIRSYGLVINLILRARFEDGWVPVRRNSAPSR